MNKKGFTLIELLAVIVILAIIALIATPIVLNIIKDSKESAGLRSAEMYLEAVEQAVSIEKMNNTSFNPSTCTIKEDGNLTCEGTDVQVEVKGEKPLKGNIVFESGKIIKIRLEYKNNKIILKNEKGNLEYFDYDRNSDINFIVEGITEQETTPGNQLFDISKFKSSSYEVNNGDGSITLTSYAPDVVNNKISECIPTIKVGDTIIFSHTVYFGGDQRASKKSLVITQEMLDNDKFAFYGQNGNSAYTISDIMINKGDTLLPYEPYTGGMPSPNPDYPQEIPLAGTLNTKTGKYDIGVTASIEGGKSQTLTLTSPVKLTKWDKLVKRDGVWGWSIWSAIDNNFSFIRQTGDETIDGRIRHRYQTSVKTIYRVNIKNYYCTHLSDAVLNSKNDIELKLYGEGYIYITFYDETGIDTLDKAKQWLADMRASGENITFVYETNTEQAFIPLPDEEQNLLYNLKF